MYDDPNIWETLDSLFKQVYEQSRRINELEARTAELEARLNERNEAEPQPRELAPAA